MLYIGRVAINNAAASTMEVIRLYKGAPPSAGGILMQRYDAVLFDVDGTLIHSRPGIFNCFAYAFRKMGLDRMR